MAETRAESSVRERIRRELEALPGVHRIAIEGPPYQILLVCDAEGASVPVEASARALLAREGLADDVRELEVSYSAPTQATRRVRFVHLGLERPRVGVAAARVELEWEGAIQVGTADGEGGAPGELRVCANATLRALEAVLGGAVTFELVGVKALRVFDHDLIAALVHCEQARDRRLVGLSMVSAGPEQAASFAVLNATNRLLGNYLLSTD